MKQLEDIRKDAVFLVIECFPRKDVTGSPLHFLLLSLFLQSLKETLTFVSNLYFLSFSIILLFIFNFSFTLPPACFFISSQPNSILKILKFRHMAGGLVTRSHFFPFGSLRALPTWPKVTG